MHICIYGKKFQKENILKTHRKKEHSFTAFHKVFDARSMKMNPSVSGNDEKETENEASQESSVNSVFQYPPLNTPPPDQLKMIMETLQMVVQKMELMEAALQKTQ